MNPKLPIITTLFAIPLLGLSIATWAQPYPAVPQQTTPEGIPYISGGIGDGEEDAMKAVRHDYNLQLTFADPQGAYLSDVHIMITDKHKKTVLDTTTNGPFLYAHLPSGRYTVSANLDHGHPYRQTIFLNSHHPKNLVYHLRGDM